MASRPLTQVAPGSDRRALDHAIATFRADIATASAHLAIDGATRQMYDRLIGELSRDLHDQAAAGRIGWREAALRAGEVRNAVMQRVRARSTPVGRAIAESLKAQGRTFNELVARYTQRLYGRNADFNRLRPAEQQAVYREIIQASGRSNAQVTARMAAISRVGRALLVVSLAVAVYNVATAEDRGAAARREGALLGGGIAGGAAGGAIAGLMCGPGAPVCVTIGAFVGGTAAAFGVSLFL